MLRKKKEQTDSPFGLADTASEPSVPIGTPGGTRLTPEEVQQKVFRVAFRGYNENDVDEFLDQVTEVLAALYQENKRMREQLQESGGGPIDLQAAEDRAEKIVRDAREHASRLVADAERRRGEVGATPAAPTAPPNWYLRQERDFLERLAGLVKDHAEDLKSRARESQEAAREAAAEAQAPPPADLPEGPAASGEEAGAEEPGAEEPGPAVVDLAEAEADAESAPRDATEADDERGEAVPSLESTAPMSAVDDEEPELLGEWEDRVGSSKGRRREEQDSLKELFWGEDS